ncbi:hypothetical protein [Ekhidna sp.]|uniref:hypothetical protein n=1 Tax=Ekhidna sp. TaxID=2608089 RepID=UPI003B5C6D88
MSFKRAPYYLSVLIGAIVLFNIVGFIKAERAPVAISSHASIPNYALQNARIYLSDKEYSRSSLYMDEAVRSFQYLRDKSTDESRQKLDAGLKALRTVKSQMDLGYFNETSLNKNSVIALNALIYYEIASAKDFILEDKRPEAMKAVSFAIDNLRYALDFAEGNKKEYEVQVFSDMDMIMSDYYMDKSDFIETLDSILVELDDLEVAY